MSDKEEKEIVDNIIIYITKTFNITVLQLNNNLREYIKLILRKVRDNNNQVKLLRIKRNKIREDISDLDASMVGSGQSFDDIQSGKIRKGFIPNTTELKIMKRLTLKEELTNLAIETQLLEKSLEDNNNLIKKFIGLLKNSNQKTIMEMTYIECMSNLEIASILFYSIEAVDINRWRSLKEFEKIVKKYIVV